MSELSEKIRNRREETDFDKLQANFIKNRKPSFEETAYDNFTDGLQRTTGMEISNDGYWTDPRGAWADIFYFIGMSLPIIVLALIGFLVHKKIIKNR